METTPKLTGSKRLTRPMLIGAIAAVEMTLELSGVPHAKGGVNAAMGFLGGA
jgi:alanine-glyoxylate transaminase/serine-glyoxylate transaminase/serine-pyruvate transaminase